MATYVYNKKLGEWELESSAPVPISDLANIPTDTILGRTTAGTGPVEELTVSDTKIMLDISSVTSAVVAGKQDAITLTTTGTSGVSTLIGATLNIPNYAGGASGFRYVFDDFQTGTVAKIIGSIRLPAGTYTPSAMIGAGNPAHIATLDIMDGATLIKAVGGVAGGLAWRSASSFTLASETDLDLYLYSNNASDNAYIRGLELV